MTKEDVKNKLNNAKETTKNVIKGTLTWLDENKWCIIAATPLILGTFNCIKTVSYNHSKVALAQTELKKRDYQVYDPSTGVYLSLRRPLTNSEKVMLAYKPSEMNVTQVLDNMGVL